MTQLPVPKPDTATFKWRNELQFLRDGEVWAVRLQLTTDGYQPSDDDSDPDAYQSSLVKLQWDGSRWQVGDIARLNDGTYVTFGALYQRLEILYDENDNSLVDDEELITAWKEYLGKIVTFLEEGSVVETNGFPVDGTFTDKIKWLFYNTTKDLTLDV